MNPPNLDPQAQSQGGWRDIESAPKDGTEINGFRADQGVFTFRWAEMNEFVPKDSNGDPTEEYDDIADWFHDRWGWMQGDETPTQWQPLPPPPATPTDAVGGEAKATAMSARDEQVSLSQDVKRAIEGMAKAADRIGAVAVRPRILAPDGVGAATDAEFHLHQAASLLRSQQAQIAEARRLLEPLAEAAAHQGRGDLWLVVWDVGAKAHGLRCVNGLVADADAFLSAHKTEEPK